jgi:hypothetical protein
MHGCDARGRDDGVRQEFGGGSKACQHLALLRKWTSGLTQSVAKTDRAMEAWYHPSMA